MDAEAPVRGDDDKVAAEVELAGRRRRRRRRGRRAASLAVAVLLVAGLVVQGAALRSEHERVQDIEARLARRERQVASSAAIVDRLLDVTAGQIRVDPGVLAGTDLGELGALPGRGRHVTAAAKRELAAATLVLVKTGSTLDWLESCTATKITDGLRSLVLTAGHCFLDDLLDRPDFQDVPYFWDVAPHSSQRYAVVDPSNRRTVLGRLGQVVMDVSYTTDIAIATVTQPTPAFEAMPAIDVGRLRSDPGPTPGQDAWVYSRPSSSSDPIGIRGTYVGRAVEVQSGPYLQDIDVVAIDPARSEEDPCWFGGSGSTAVLADGTVLGPLSSRDSLGYRPGREVIDPDVVDRVHRVQLEAALKVRLDRPPVLCGYTAPSLASNIDLVLQHVR